MSCPGPSPASGPFTPPASQGPPALLLLPPELHALICQSLDIPDLLALSRTCRTLRPHALSTHLHTLRLARIPAVIARKIATRPQLREIMSRRIYITRTSAVAGRLGWRLIVIKLNHHLALRPTAAMLVEKGVLPAECYPCAPVRGALNESRHSPKRITIAPGLIEVKRRVEREKTKDALRGWVALWRAKGKERERDKDGEREGIVNVRRAVKRWARVETEQRGRWHGQRQRELPTRAKVLGLRRYWESVAKERTE